jgi:hypothetical protein
LPTQSYKTTVGSINDVTIPIATESNDLGDFKPNLLYSLNGKACYVMSSDVIDTFVTKSKWKIYLVRMQIDLSQKPGEVIKFDKLKYSYNGIEKSDPINIIFEAEYNTDFPILIGSFEVREDKDDMIFEIINDTNTDIPIKNIDVGTLVTITERKIIDDKGNEKEVKNDLILKAREKIKQRIKFARNRDALCELSLKVIYGNDNKSKGILGFSLPGTAAEYKIEKIIKESNK